MNKLSIFATLLVAFWGFQSCEDPNSVGSGIIPDTDAIAVDSLKFEDFKVNILRDDSLYTANRSTLYLGNVTKENLGDSYAAIYSEFSYADTLDASNTILDSAVVYLNPTGYFGVDDAEFEFEVYNLTDSIPPVSEILISTTLPTDQQIATIIGHTKQDSIYVNGEKYKNHFHGRLDQSFAQELFEKLPNISTNQQLQQELKGIKVIGENTENGLFEINIANSVDNLSGIHFFYTDATNKAESVRLRMQPMSENVTDTSFVAGVSNFNEFNGNYTNPVILNQLDNYSSTGYELAAVDSGNGIISEIKFSDLQSEFTGTETINSAELIIDVDLTNRLQDTLQMPEKLFLAEEFARNSQGEKTGALIGIDGSGLVSTNTDRIYDRTAEGFKQKRSEGKYYYTFYLPNYIERVKNGTEPATLYIAPLNRISSLNGFTFNSNTDIQLDIKYSKTN